MNDPWSDFLVSSVSWLGTPHGEAIRQVRDAGFGGVEILCKPGHFEQGNRTQVDEVKAALDEWPGVIVTFHAPFYGVDLAATDFEARDRTMREMRVALDDATLMRSRNMTVHVRSREAARGWEAASFDALHNALGRLVHAARERDMALAVENFAPPHFTSDEHDLLGVIERYPADRVGACIDVGHAHLGGRVVQVSGALASRAFVAHLHDNDGHSGDMHVPPGEGTIPWMQVVEELRANGFRGHKVLEVVMNGVLDETLRKLKASITNVGLSELIWKDER